MNKSEMLMKEFYSEINKRIQKEREAQVNGVKVNMEYLKQKPMHVIYRDGEIFAGHIDWSDLMNGIIKYSDDCNVSDEPGIMLPGGGCGYAGFHSPSGTYTRYKEDGEYCSGEHCMQILKIIE